MVSETFLSTPSARRATPIGNLTSQLFAFLSTPSARRATKIGQALSDALDISIHALREEGDVARHLGAALALRISIHALREEGDWSPTTMQAVLSHFYPRPPRGGRHETPDDFTDDTVISIHALREEGDHRLEQCTTGQ